MNKIISLYSIRCVWSLCSLWQSFGLYLWILWEKFWYSVRCRVPKDRL